MKSKEKLLKELRTEVINFAAEIEEAAQNGKIAGYFDDPCDIEIRIGGDLQYQSVEVLLAGGGPDIRVDTRTGEVVGKWGGDSWKKYLSMSANHKIDDYFENYYATCR